MNEKTTALKTTDTARKGAKFAKKKYEEALSGENPVAWGMARLGGAHAILKALGVIPLYPENYATVCAAKQVSVPYLDLSAAEGLSRYLCGYFRTDVGFLAKYVKEGKAPEEAPWGGIAKPDFFLPNWRWKLCDEGVKFFHNLGRYIDVPSFTLDLPVPPPSHIYAEARPYYVRYCEDQYRELQKFIENLTGRKMDMVLFEEAVDNTLETMRLWYECNELRKAVPCPMPAQDAWSCLVPGYYWPGDKESAEFYTELHGELTERVANRTGSVPNEQYRLVFTEGAPYHSLSVFDYFAEIGVVIVIEGAYYEPGPPPEIASDADPFHKLALRYFADYDVWLQKATEGAGTWETERYLDWATGYQCDGAIMHHCLDCRAISTLLPHIRNMLLERACVPSYFLENCLVDPRDLPPIEKIKSEMQAFLEVMDHHKELRLQNGLPVAHP
ncbi:MAG: 2-hydroxyacyl-CoA dehydratase [Desulfobacteraceae bacterium]|nr:MAG: 2-hydroxyacyl-CoA dehydratase [Desulfobacteraceae bacterium]